MSRLIVPFGERVSRPINLLIPPELLAAIDKARGDVPRSEFIRRACAAALAARGVQL